MGQMPPEFISHDTVADMLPGDVRYVVPWAVKVDEDWQCWIDGSHEASLEPGGTVDLWVARTPDGFTIQPLASHRWRPGPVRDGWLPVARVLPLERQPRP